jgi:hypothetical protein
MRSIALCLAVALGAAPQSSLTVTVMPSPAPTATSAPSGVATLYGCNMYPADSVFNTTNLTVSPTSSQQIQSYMDSTQGSGGTPNSSLTLQVQTEWHVNYGSNPTYYTDHSTSGHAPISSGFPWSSTAVVSEHNADDHGEFLDTTNAPNHCKAYGGYWGNGNDNINNTTHSITFYASQVSDLGDEVDSSGVNAPDMAGDIPAIPGLLVYQQYADTGGWHHALDITVGNYGTCTNGYDAPALGNGGLTYSGPSGTDTTDCLPYGAHVRLKSTYDCTSFSAQNQAICTTLKTYGAFVNDTGGSANKLIADDDSRWGSTSQLNFNFSQFEVVTGGTN